eukprot:5250121-Pleurochrysis_carterae.AAC.4
MKAMWKRALAAVVVVVLAINPTASDARELDGAAPYKQLFTRTAHAAAMQWLADERTDQQFEWSSPLGTAVLAILQGLLLQPITRIAKGMKRIGVPGVIVQDETTSALGGLIQVKYNISDLRISGLDSTSAFKLQPSGNSDVSLTSSLETLRTSCIIEAEVVHFLKSRRPIRMRIQIDSTLTEIQTAIKVKCILRKHMLRALVTRDGDAKQTRNALQPDLALEDVNVRVKRLTTHATKAQKDSKTGHVATGEQLGWFWGSFNTIFGKIIKRQVEVEIEQALRDSLSLVLLRANTI